MIDKENVINGLECCNSQKPNSDCKKSCPFYSSYSTSRCRERLHADAIALLEEHEESIPLKPLCDWLAGYAAPPGKNSWLALYGDMSDAWQAFLRKVNLHEQ